MVIFEGRVAQFAERTVESGDGEFSLGYPCESGLTIPIIAEIWSEMTGQNDGVGVDEGALERQANL